VYEVQGARAASSRGAKTIPSGPRTGQRKDTIVIPCPNSAVPAAIGFDPGRGLPFEMGPIRRAH